MKFRINTFILFFYFLFFYLIFHNKGQILYGDFGSTFIYNNLITSQEFIYSWLNSNFIGYESSFYSLIRIPFYITVDFINIIFGNQFYWLFFVFMYFLRYYFFSLFISKFNQNNIIVSLISFIYSMNFYFIDRSGHILISFASITIPLLIYSYNKLIHKVTVKDLLILFFSLVVIMSSMHVTLMTIYFFGLYITFKIYKSYRDKKIKLFIFNNVKIFIFLTLTLPYIYLPLIFSKLTSSSLNVIDQVGLQASGWIYELSANTDIVNTLSGTGFLYSFITKNPIIVSINTIFVIIGIYIIINRKDNNKEHREYWIYLGIYLVFMFLSTRVIVLKFIEIFKDYLIGFNAVKDNSYFLLYQQFAFFTLLAIKAKDISKKNILIIVLSLWSLFFVGVNTFAFRNNEIFQFSNIPDSYYEINNHLPNDGRVLVLPFGWVTKFDWTGGFTSGFFNIFLADYEIVGQNIIEGPSINTQNKIQEIIDCFNNNCEDVNLLIDNLALKYIVLFNNGIDLSKDFESNDKISYFNNINYLEKNNIISRIYEGVDYSIYAFNSSITTPKIRSTDIEYTNINPTQYKLNIKNIKEKQNLEFLESYHNNWKLYLKEFDNKSKNCDIVRESNNYNKSIKECESKSKLFESWDLHYILQKPIFEDSHKLVYDYANQWTIDPEYIKANFDKSYYKENSDGSIDIELVLYFKPQVYFYLGVIVSTIFITLSFIYLIYIVSYQKLSNLFNKFNNKVSYDNEIL